MADRFWNKVRPTGFCWEWTGATTRGYGRISQRTYGQQLAHRYSYMLLVGDPGELSLDHLCRNTLCANPDHLEPVTHAENVRRGRAKSGLNKPTTCKSGHEYTEQNSKWTTRKNGSRVRVCRTCNRAAQKRYYEKED